jgi:AcrR family transcriptional regulator
MRHYQLGRRRERVDRTRARLVAAARRTLMTREGVANFSLETVARRAGVTRLTVYHQFGSKVGLLEAVYDDLARRGHIAERLAAAFQLPEPLACLNTVVAAFMEFWNSERIVIRRLRSMAVLDPSFRGATDRDQRRQAAMANVLHRLEARNVSPDAVAECASMLAMLTSFEAFDALAGKGRQPDLPAITARVQALVRIAAEEALSA